MEMNTVFGLCTEIESKLRMLSYGNHCGPGKGENEPIDEIDKCCKHHDRCWTLVDR